MENRYSYEQKEKLIIDINNLKGYQGYVQFSHRAIDIKKDVFETRQDIHVKDESGFIYEAHFCNGHESISIKQINGSWLISPTTLDGNEDTQSYISDIKEFNYKIKMAQIWEEKKDTLCEDMKVKKLKKVVFAGFVKGDSK